MTTEPTAPLLTTGTAVRVVATGLAGAALSAERHSTLMRRTGWVLAAGAGCLVGVSAGRAEAGRPSPVAAAGLGVTVFALTGGTSEAAVWAQRRFERWADAAFGRPRLAVGVATGALALLVDVADEWQQRTVGTGRGSGPATGITSGA